jgi:hypothetical protein
MMDPDVAAVVEELDAHRQRFEAFCRSLSLEQLRRAVPRSSWQVQDFVAHLATIDEPISEMFRTIHAGGDPGLRSADGAPFNVDHWNDSRVAERRDRPLDALLAEAARTRAGLHTTLKALDANDVQKVIRFGGDNKRPAGEIRLLDFLRGWCKHDPMHAVDMMRALPEVESPELAAWFDDPTIRGYQAAMNRDA